MTLAILIFSGKVPYAHHNIPVLYINETCELACHNGCRSSEFIFKSTCHDWLTHRPPWHWILD